MNNARPESYGAGWEVPRPTRTMWMDTTQLYQSAHAWEWVVSSGLSQASYSASLGLTSRHLFGPAMGELGAAHDALAEMLVDGLAAGGRTSAVMGSALRVTADDWRRTDDGAAEAEDRLRSRL